MHQQPPAYPGYVTTSPSEGIPMDCGMLPSQLHPPGHGASRRRIVPPQGPEQGEVGSGDGRAQVGPQRDSRESPGGVYDVTHDFETHEASSHTSTPSPSFGRDSQLQSPANPHYAVASSAPPQSDRPFHAYGWVEYLLPDESLYYVHQTYQVVTDVDLGDETLLDAVMTYLQDHDDNISPGQEFWLQNTGSHEGGFVPLRCFVDHSKQSVVFDSSHEANGDDEHNVRHGYANDRLNAKYRYWSFMEAHPAHTSLPLDSHQDAIDALNWASTDELLPPHRSISAPFTREECQSLKTLLQSFDQRGETSLRTRTVSKILLRVVCWRQSRLHPNKLRPVEADRSSFRKDFMPACNSTFILATMVYVCLVMTITLCLSQTFTKIAGIGAILFLMSPVVSNIVAIIQSRFSVNKSPGRSDSG
ncbi:hypothetical protein BD779DRAFT_351369 [Infundibulicybe gibba]|nr:hypothetical protein BD779DRAFT_351369 [Infundibulicybe gibba]